MFVIVSTNQRLDQTASRVREGIDRIVQGCKPCFQYSQVAQDGLCGLSDNYRDGGQEVDEGFDLHIQVMILGL
jgi:hypothetical protein